MTSSPSSIQKKFFFSIEYGVSVILLSAFTVYFGRDFYLLKKYFVNTDVTSHYFPFRNWFTQRLLQGEFPIWNPYWGIGNTTQVGATIPIDFFTLLEFIFGPQYHYFYALQIAFVMAAGLIAFTKLGFSPMVAAAGSVLFFISPLVTFFYLYFTVTNCYIGLILSFTFVYLWFSEKHPKYLFFLFWTVVFYTFGSRLDFLFFQAVFLGFLCLISAGVFSYSTIYDRVRMALFPILAVTAGTLAHAWQFNLLLRISEVSERISGGSPSNIFLTEMYVNLWSSIVDSRLWKLLIIGGLIYFGMNIKKRTTANVLLFLAILAAIVFLVWQSSLLYSFLKSPIALGAALGVILSFILISGFNWKDCGRTMALFFMFIYYWCRPAPGILDEMQFMSWAPTTFKVIIAAMFWLGCSRFQENRLVRIAWFCMVAVLFARTQGLIILSYLSGFLWMPGRDNYLIDFLIAIIAMSGMTTFDRLWSMRTCGLGSLVAVASVVTIIFSWPPAFYNQTQLKTPFPEFTYDKEAGKISSALSGLNLRPTDRIYFHPFIGPFGHGASLSVGMGQVAMNDNFNPRNYRDWTFYKRTGIEPKENWAGYPGDFGKYSSWLPKLNTYSMTSSEAYYFTMIARPPLDEKAIRFLGVKYLGLFKFVPDRIAGPLKSPFDWGRESYFKEFAGMDALVERFGLSEMRNSDWLLTARLSDPLPRAFLVSGVTESNMKEFSSDMDSVYEDETMVTKSSVFPVRPAVISNYEPERISISVQAKKEGYLVLTDLNHPFWHARLDGEEVEIARAFYLYRGVKISAGQHEVEFYCEVPYFKTCVAISIFMIVASIFIFFILKIATRDKRDMSMAVL